MEQNKRAQAGMLGVVLIAVIISIAIMMFVRRSAFSVDSDIEARYFDIVTTNALFSLLATTDDSLEAHITIYDLIKSAKEGRKVGIQDAKTYTPSKIDQKMQLIKKRFLDRYSEEGRYEMHYYLYVGDIERPVLSAGDYDLYEECKRSPNCRLKSSTAEFEDIRLMFYKRIIT